MVDIDGDGSFLMNCQEMATARVEGLDTKMLILNNQHLGMVVQWEDRFYKANRAHTYLGRKEGASLLWPPSSPFPQCVLVCTQHLVAAQLEHLGRSLAAAVAGSAAADRLRAHGGA